MTEPLVSVIIPVFDGERFLGAAIESALAQTYEQLEVIVVDDGSADASAAIAERHPVRLVRRPHLGVSAACNAGSAAARGELLAFLDADDLWPADRIAVQAGHLLARPDLGFVMGHAVQFLEPDADRPEWMSEAWIAGVRAPGDEQTAPPHPDVTVPVPHPATLLVRADVFQRVGAFDEEMDIGQDIDWLMRATDAGIRHELLPGVVLRHRLHSSNSSYRLADATAARLRVARRSAGRKREGTEWA
jgi:glycosyltransferase involved in cell wall biosynthesis